MPTERTRDDAPARTALWTVGLLLLAVVLWQLRDIVVLVAYAVLLAYVLDPMVRALEALPVRPSRKMPRPLASAVVMLSLAAMLVWVLSLALPRLGVELQGYIQNLPQALETLLTQIRDWAARHRLAGLVEPAVLHARASGSTIVEWIGVTSARWIASLFGSLIQILGLALLPLLTFYLLAERNAVRASLMDFLPQRAHGYMEPVRRAVNRGVVSYVRGQGLVCLLMGTITGTALAVIGYPVALLLGVIVAIAEVIPYLGYWLAAVAIGIAGATQGLVQALIGVGIYTVVNQVVGVFVTPRVMSKHLKLHPFFVMLSILAGGELLGPAGAVLALPGAAIAQSLIAELAPRRAAKHADKKQP